MRCWRETGVIASSWGDWPEGGCVASTSWLEPVKEYHAFKLGNLAKKEERK